ncbi:ParB/RepB/Spo0J family partition protein [Vicingus serpentipes]|jgi:ParB family transcriptional regulator, chromosome partitioning protein|uniref:ParB/RepB/Spo0J family partition protein n=1 Tax=Vicingus serpentipes TaxID=1926625 RepID=A0A5C6RX66_9FLAO|nr:ParB/RepB/Spo0J family partition protein [Vicingus serpentipes]TXB65952.1 ParB/RepB/Spo0J family partition protein [Vicingus serpentipes]
MSKKPALGRGLGALLQSAETDITSNKLEETPAIVGSVSTLPIEYIEANPFQPRTQFEKEALLELADSISELGIIQPVTVRKLGYGKYQLISGERRFRASQIAGLTEIPAFIRIANDQEMLEMALVENIQRENLDAVEVAFSYQKLIEECNLTQEKLSERVGKKRSTVANYLRLLKLPAEIQLAIRTKDISMGHARAIVNIEDDKKQLAIYKRVVKEGLSVRQVEEIVKGKKDDKVAEFKKGTNSALTFTQQKIQEDLTSFLKSDVQLQSNSRGRGKIVIPFTSEDQLERIVELLGL